MPHNYDAIPGQCDLVNFMLGYIGWPKITEQVVDDLSILTGVDRDLIVSLVRYGHVSQAAQLTPAYQAKLDAANERRRAHARQIAVQEAA